ncbi:MAG: condensation domain-containing protein, partial [Chthoniobacterales bacterium]
MSEDKRALFKAWLQNGEARLHPLTFSQRELWETSPASPADVSNHICCFINVRGRVSEQDGVASMQRVVERQEVLRASILPGKNGPLQLVRNSAEPAVRFRDVAPDTSPAQIEEFARQTFSAPFDLVTGPLYRVEIIRRGAEDQTMVLAIHHAIADGWSLGVLVQDLAAAYLMQRKGAGNRLPPVPTSYSAWG